MSVIDRTDRGSPPDTDDEVTIVDDADATTTAPGSEATTEPAPADVPDATAEPTTDPGPREVRVRGPKGMRIRRIRLLSVLKIATVFFVLGYLVTLASLVVVWNVAQRLGFVESVEDTLVTSLGLDTFEVVGQELFDLAVVGFGLLFAMGLVITLLLTIVYNATCALMGGLAVETGSLRRPKRVFSLRHRRFITVR